jgi:hypothetical protein
LLRRLRILRASPWVRVLDLAWLVLTRLRTEIPVADRRRLAELLRGTKGNPRNLGAAEREEIRRIVAQVDFRDLAKEAALRQVPARGVGRVVRLARHVRRG